MPGGVAADGAVGQVRCARTEQAAAVVVRGGVAADRAVGQVGRAEIVEAASGTTHRALVMVRPEIDAVTPVSTWKTRVWPPPLIVTPAAGPVIVCVPVVLLNSSRSPASVIVFGVLKTVASKSMVLAPTSRRHRRSPTARCLAVAVGRTGDGERREQPALLQLQQSRS